MKSKKWLSFLLAAVMMLTMVPMTALAADGTGGGTIAAITSGGTVGGDTVTFAGTELNFSKNDDAQGRFWDGWYFGVKITAPASVADETALEKVRYSNNGSDYLTKRLADTKDGKDTDGKYYLNCWPHITADSLEKDLKDGITTNSWTYKFDWDGDGTVDQTFTITIDLTNLVLKNESGNGNKCVTADGNVIVKDGAATTNVASVNGKEYWSAQAAIGNASAGDTVTLLADATSVWINEGAPVTIDLNGHKISSDGTEPAILNYGGPLTVIDSAGGGVVDGGQKGALVNYAYPDQGYGAVATLKGGTFIGSKWYVIKNLGELTIDGATVVQDDINSSAIANGFYGNNGGGNDFGVKPVAGYTVSLTINSGSVSGGVNAVKNDEYGVLNISGGEFETNATNGAVILNWNKAEIIGGTFTAGENTPAVISNGSYGDTGVGKLTIKGGEFSGGTALFGDPAGNDKKAVTTITDGKFTGSFPASSDADINISGGTYSKEVPSGYAAEGFAPVQNTDGSYGVHTHSFGEDWKYDETHHWHECGCGEADEKIAHDYKDALNDEGGHWLKCVCGAKTYTGAHKVEVRGYKAATKTEPGYTGDLWCTICGEQTGIGEEIPVLTGSGEDKPITVKPEDTTAPKTGDESNVALWFILLGMSAVGLAGAMFYGKRRKHSAR